MTTKIDRETIQHVAGLARLRLSDDEQAFYESRMAQVISYFSQMDSIAGKLGADWRADTQGHSTPEREDVVRNSSEVEEVMQQAPQRIGTAFQVPKIIE